MTNRSIDLRSALMAAICTLVFSTAFLLGSTGPALA